MLRISLDIDDTLANFSEGYLQRFKKWPKCDWAITRNVNNILIHEREFWLGLPVLNTVDFQPKMYCSARVNNKKWTKKYLKDRGFPDAPLYQIPGTSAFAGRTLRREDNEQKNYKTGTVCSPCLQKRTPAAGSLCRCI